MGLMHTGRWAASEAVGSPLTLIAAISQEYGPGLENTVTAQSPASPFLALY